MKKSWRQLFVIDKYNKTEKYELFVQDRGLNVAVFYWNVTEPYFIIDDLESNKIKRQDFHDFQQYSNIYNSLFRDQFSENHLKHISMFFYPLYTTTQTMVVLNNITNEKLYFGVDVYLFNLMGKQITETRRILSFSDSAPLQMNVTSIMKDDLILIKECSFGTKECPIPTKADILLIILDDFRTKTENDLFPHDIRKMVILVPNTYIVVSLLLSHQINSPIVNVWIIVIILVSLIRILIQHKEKAECRTKITHIILDTFGTAFTGICHIKITNRSERIIVVSLSIFSIISSAFICGYIFKHSTMTEQRSTINSIEDLNKSNLVIYAEFSSFVYAEYLTERYHTILMIHKHNELTIILTILQG